MANNEPLSSFSGRLKAARKLTGLTQREIGAQLSIDYTTYNKWETGSRTPNIEFLEKFYKITGVNLHWLLTGDGEMLNKADIRSIYPGLPGDDKVYELIECLQVPAVYHAVISDFLLTKKKLEPLIEDYFKSNETKLYIADHELRLFIEDLNNNPDYRDKILGEHFALYKKRL